MFATFFLSIIIALIYSDIAHDTWGKTEQWVLFLITAPAFLAIIRFDRAKKLNIFDYIGYLVGIAVPGFISYVFMRSEGFYPPVLLFGIAIGLPVGAGIIGIFSIPAFLLELVLPKRPTKVRVRRQHPYSVPDEGGAFDYDPARFSAGRSGGPGTGKGHQQPGHGPNAPPRSSDAPTWAALMKAILLGPPAKTEAERHKAEQIRKARAQAAANAEREARERAARVEREKRAREEAALRQRLTQQSEDDKYREALRLFGLEDGYTLETLRTRYRELSKRVHPDAGGTAGLFQQIDAAFKILSKKAR